MNRFKKYLLLGLGFLFTGLGVVGIFLPLMPTTVWLLLAAACFAHVSPRFHRWLLEHRVLGSYIRNYVEKRGMTPAHKRNTLLLLWGTIGLSGWLVRERLPVLLVLLAVAIGVSIHILTLPTDRNGSEGGRPESPENELRIKDQ